MPLSLLSSAFPFHHPILQTTYPLAAVSSNMRTFSLLTIGTAALAMISSLPSACAAAIEKRDAASDARAFLQDATSQVASVKSKLTPLLTRKNLANSAFVSANVVPLVSEINTITANTVSKVNALKAKSNAKRQEVDVDAVADALVDLVNEVGVAIKPLEDFLRTLPVLGGLVGGILDSINNNLSTIVTGLGEVIGGLLEVVRELLGGLLGGLGGVLGGLLGGLGLKL